MNKGLSKYNRVVSQLVRYNQRKKIPYKFRDIQRQASKIYRGNKDVKLRGITQKWAVGKQSEIPKLVIGAEDIPNYWFESVENFKNWWQVGEWAVKFSNVYPEIPIIIKTKGNMITTKGAMGNYDGSLYQEFTEKLRVEFEDMSSSEFPFIFGTPAYKKGKKHTYAFWGAIGVKLPKVPPTPEQIEVGKKQVIIERETEKDKQEKETKRLKRKKKPLPPKKKVIIEKPPKKKKVDKVIEKKKPSTDRVKEIRGMISDFRQDLKDGLITKKDYQVLVKDLVKNMKRGGKI